MHVCNCRSVCMCILVGRHGQPHWHECIWVRMEKTLDRTEAFADLRMYVCISINRACMRACTCMFSCMCAHEQLGLSPAERSVIRDAVRLGRTCAYSLEVYGHGVCLYSLQRMCVCVCAFVSRGLSHAARASAHQEQPRQRPRQRSRSARCRRRPLSDS
jgi:hypothetical protein